jgi:hypothetical protein
MSPPNSTTLHASIVTLNAIGNPNLTLSPASWYPPTKSTCNNVVVGQSNACRGRVVKCRAAVLVLADLGGRAVGEARVPAPPHALRRRQLAGPLALEEEDGLGERLPVVVRGGAAVLGDGVAGELQRRRDEESEDE